MHSTRGTERLLRWHWRSNWWKSRLLRAADAAFVGVWLGLFDREDLAALDETFYRVRREPLAHGGVAGYTDEAWTRNGLFDWEQALLEDYVPPAARILVTGAGGGREVLALLGQGYDATGYEPNAVLVEHGTGVLAAEGHADRLHLTARDEFPPVAAGWDAVLVGWGAYQFIPGRGHRRRFLQDARAAMAPEGCLILSFLTRQEGDPDDATIARVGTAVRRLRRADPVELGDNLRPQFAHRFTRNEMAAELSDAGFQMTFYGDTSYGHAVARPRPEAGLAPASSPA